MKPVTSRSSRDQDFFQCLLLSRGAVPVDPPALMEAVTHHALAKQKKNDCQDDYKQELSHSERGRLSSGRGRRIQRSCHQSCVSTRSKLLHFHRVLPGKRRLYHFEHIRISEQADQSRNQPARCHGIRAVGACGAGSDSSSRSAIS